MKPNMEMHKEKCQKVMMYHLAELGYPNMTRQQIVNELKDMWRKLEEAGLIVDGMNYQEYLQQADYALTKAEFDDITGI
jgi:hypothetical protein